MLDQIVLSFLEDIILSYFISNMILLKSNYKYIIINTFICCVLTLIFNVFGSITNLLPFFMFGVNILVLKMFKKNLTLYDLIIIILGLIIIILTDLISLLFFDFFIDVSLFDLGNQKCKILFASFLAKIILLISLQIILLIKPRNKGEIFMSKWSILIPICLTIFFNIYFLGSAIVYSNLTKSMLYVLIIGFVILSILVIFLCYIIFQECLSKKDIELNLQKESYIKKEKNMIIRLHNEIQIIEHNNLYVFLKMKYLLKNHQYDEICKEIDKKILQCNKNKQYVYTGDTFFDYMLNNQIYSYNLDNYDIKVISNILNEDVEIEQEDVIFIANTIKYLLSICNKEKSFTISFNMKKPFLCISIYFNNIDKINDCILLIYEKDKTEHLKYKYQYEEDIIVFKLTYRIER